MSAAEAAPELGPVLAAGAWNTNAELIADVARLGYLTDDGPTWDGTYGLGNWWTVWRPRTLFRTDEDPAKSPDYRGGLDATYTPFEDGQWQHVVLDPPYGLAGSGRENRYGIDVRMSERDRHALMARMLLEGARVTAVGGTLLFRCADQVEGARLRPQSAAFGMLGQELGLVWEDLFHFSSYRPQPAGRSQQHARRNLSQLLVFTKPRRPRLPGVLLPSLDELRGVAPLTGAEP